MVAVLKLVPKPVTRPVYRRHDLLNFYKDWLEANRDLLLEWFRGGDMKDFGSFCRSQHEIECNQHDQFKETYRGP